MQLAPPTGTDRLRIGLDRAERAAVAMEAPMSTLVPGVVSGDNAVRVQRLALGAAQAADGVLTLLTAGRSLRERGELPTGALASLLRFEQLDRSWLGARAYLSGIRDAGFVPGYAADTLWTSLPELIHQTQQVAAQLRAVLDGA